MSVITTPDRPSVSITRPAVTDPASEGNRRLVAEAIAQLIAVDGPQSPVASASAGSADVYCAGPERHVCGVRGARPADATLFAAFSEPELTIERQREAGDRVITHIVFRGRHTRGYRGVAPSGRTMQARGVLIHDLRGGRIVDAWSLLHWR